MIAKVKGDKVQTSEMCAHHSRLVSHATAEKKKTGK